MERIKSSKDIHMPFEETDENDFIRNNCISLYPEKHGILDFEFTKILNPCSKNYLLRKLSYLDDNKLNKIKSSILLDCSEQFDICEDKHYEKLKKDLETGCHTVKHHTRVYSFCSLSSVEHDLCVKKQESINSLSRKVSIIQKNLVKNIEFDLEPNVRTRNYMEDFINIHSSGTQEKIIVLCDGHNGEYSAKTTVESLPNILLLNVTKYGKEQIKEVFERSFMEMDEVLKNNSNESDKSGATCNVVYLCVEKNKTVAYSANVGDSRTLLIKKDDVTRMSYDHKARDKSETLRIKQANGHVIRGRFYMQLDVSRSLGDFDLKGVETPGLICLPHISRVELESTDKYLIIASDGVWDVITDNEMYALIIEYEKKENLSTTLQLTLAQHIVRTALELGSRDNISCIVITL